MGLSNIKGVGPATVKKLNAAGVNTLADMRAMDIDAVAEKTGIASTRLREWKTEAKLTKVLDDIKGIGPASKKKLQDAGIHSVDDLARASIHEIAHATSLAVDRVKKWQVEAQKNLKQVEAKVRAEGGVAVQKGKAAAKKAKAQTEAAAAEARKRTETLAAEAKRRGEAVAHDVEERVERFRHPETPAAGGNGNGNGMGTEGTNGQRPGFFTRLKSALFSK